MIFLRNLFLFSLFLNSFFSFAQSSCSTAKYLKDTTLTVNSASQDYWFRFRAKGAGLKLDFSFLNQSDSLVEYELFEDQDCQSIQSIYTEPIRKVKKGLNAVSQETWNLAVDSGYCVCDVCLQKLSVNQDSNLNVEQGRIYLAHVWSNGKPFNVTIKNIEIDPNVKTQFVLSEGLETLEKGMVYQLREVKFEPASPEVLPVSFDELNKIKAFLTKNDVISIEIRGHVNGPLDNKPEYYQSLSDARAKAIKDFLIKNGIAENRITTVGLANKEMKYPSPKSEWEAEQNRRVEILIVSAF